MIVEFVKRYHYQLNLAEYIKPLKKFNIVSDKMVDSELLTEADNGDISKMDKLIKQYFKEHLEIEVVQCTEFGPVETISVRLLIDGEIID